MKEVIILGALALVLVSGLEQNEEESQLSLSEKTLQREARDAPPRKRRKNKKKKGKKSARKSGGRNEQKTKKRGSKRRGSKKNVQKSGGKNKQKGKKRGSKRKGSKDKAFSARQGCLTDVVDAIRAYRLAVNQKRMAMRIIGWKNNMGKKKDKAATQFGDAADALDAATSGGQTCGSGKPDSATLKALAKLKNCSKTATALCDNSTVNDTGADACKTKFVAYLDAFEVCLKTPSCDCFKALTPVESSCKFNDANNAAKDLKEKCFKSDTPGSFGDCSGALKKAAGKIGKCGFGVGTTDGAGTSTKSARNLRRLAFHKFGGDSNI